MDVLLVLAAVILLPLALSGAVAWSFSRATAGWSRAAGIPTVIAAWVLTASVTFLLAASVTGAWLTARIP